MNNWRKALLCTAAVITSAQVSAEVVDIKNTNEFNSEVLECKDPVLVLFKSQSCHYCKQMLPIFTALEKECGNKLKFAKLESSKCPDLVKKYSIRGLPNFNFFKNGQRVKQEVGEMSKKELQQIIDLQLAATKPN